MESSNSKVMTGSLGDNRVSFSAAMNSGSIKAGIPSFGGPPDMISERSTEWMEKSVRGHSDRHFAGFAFADTTAETIKQNAISSLVNIAAPD